MRKCCIVGCTSGYQSNTEKVSVFGVPLNPELRKKWSDAICRPDYVISNNTGVCEKHFAPEDIIRFWESGSDETLLVRLAYLVPRLKKSAVPSIFPGPACASKKCNKKKIPTKRKNAKLSKKNGKCQDVEEIADVHTFDDPVVNTNLYDLIKYSISEGTLKSYCSWVDASVPKIGDTADSNYSFVSFCHSGPFPVIEKSVVVSTNGDVTFGVLGKKIEAKKLGIIPAKSLDDFANNLRQFENIYVCHGGPQVKKISKALSSLCIANSVGRLQHTKCCLIMKRKAVSCIKCRQLEHL